MSKRIPRSLADINQIGLVDPSEYDWENQFLLLAEVERNDPQGIRVMDVGKVLGIARAYARLLRSRTKPLFEVKPIKGGNSSDSDTKI